MKKGKHKPSAKKTRMGVSSPLMPLRPSGSTSTSWRLYRDCRIELDRFLDAHFDKDYERIVISGEPTEAAIKEAWSTIYLQFSEMAQVGNYNELFDKTMKVQELNGRITVLDGIVQHLQICYDPMLVAVVNEMGIYLVLDRSEDPIRKLKIVQGRVKRMILDMEKMEKELEVLQKIKGSASGREEYEDWLAIMSKSSGYAVRAKDISVAQYLRNQRRLNEQFQKQQADGNRKD